MNSLPSLDLAVVIAYLVVIVGVGGWFARRSGSTEEFMAGGHRLPGWALGLSMFGSYVSSISFLANPGKAYESNWNPFVFSLATPLAAAVAVRWFMPFYRRTGAISAYEHLEQRFGPWARTYAVVCFLLTQMARSGTVIYLLAMAVAPLTGWDVRVVIVLTGCLMTVYTMAGGLKAVVWTGVVQSVVLVAGPIICLVALLTQVPGGAAEIVATGWKQGKFSLGSLAPNPTASTFWVVLIYGLVINLGNFGIDQSYVQRYVTAPDNREAAKSIWLTALLYTPVAALFFLIGTGLSVFYSAKPELLAGITKADAVFPHFIATQLPMGMGGLVVAAIFAASMDSNLNSMATLTLNDLYRRYLRPGAGERESMRVLHWSTLLWGAAGTGIGLLMTRFNTALDAWWKLAGIFSGGMLGLFLLGLASRRATSRAAGIGTAIGVAVILWLTFSPKAPWLPWWARNPLHDFMTIVLGTLAILVVGWGLSRSGEATIAPSERLD